MLLLEGMYSEEHDHESKPDYCLRYSELFLSRQQDDVISECAIHSKIKPSMAVMGCLHFIVLEILPVMFKLLVHDVLLSNLYHW